MSCHETEKYNEWLEENKSEPIINEEQKSCL